MLYKKINETGSLKIEIFPGKDTTQEDVLSMEENQVIVNGYTDSEEYMHKKETIEQSTISLQDYPSREYSINSVTNSNIPIFLKLF